MFKFLSGKFTPTLLCRNFVKFGWREITEIVRYLPDKKISPASQTVATERIAPKICQGQPSTMHSECTRFHPNRFTFGGGIAERVITAKSCPKVNPIFDGSLASSLIMRSRESAGSCKCAQLMVHFPSTIIMPDRPFVVPRRHGGVG